MAFFLAEMGNKTRIASVALIACRLDLLAVVTGTALGMMRGNVPALLLGDLIAKTLPMAQMHGAAAGLRCALRR